MQRAEEPRLLLRRHTQKDIILRPKVARPLTQKASEQLLMAKPPTPRVLPLKQKLHLHTQKEIQLLHLTTLHMQKVKLLKLLVK